MRKQYLILSYLLCCGFFAQAQLPSVIAGKLVRIDSFPSQYLGARKIDIWLPDSYDGKTPHAVLYMHDGQMLFDSNITWNKKDWRVDETLHQLMQEGKIRNTIVVGAWNGGISRHVDYFPQKPFESLPAAIQDTLYGKNRPNGASVFNGLRIRSDLYLKFLVKELKPYIDAQYQTKKDPPNTFIAGSSMGGLISLYAICEYPEVFGGAACLSTHWPGIFTNHMNPIPDAFLTYLQTHLPDNRKHKIYFDHGTDTLDSLYAVHQDRVDALMRSMGWSKRNWMSRVFPGTDHSEQAWAARLDIPMMFLLSK
jgi:predicted alpha/beta superfamily hydrolase